MASSMSSVRLDEDLKETASNITRGKGSSPAPAVSASWKDVVATGGVPGVDTPAATVVEESSPFDRIMELRAKMPTGTPLSIMGKSELRKELAGRD